MRNIEVDEDVYAHIARNTREIGEPATKILRRLLDLNGDLGSPKPVSEKHELSDALGDPAFRVHWAAVDKMLYLLSTANKQRPDKFDRVLKIQGRDRKYFARSKEEIEASGSSTQPRQIPGSPFWVMTNSPTPQKAAMLRDVLRVLDYSKEAVDAAVTAIRK